MITSSVLRRRAGVVGALSLFAAASLPSRAAFVYFKPAAPIAIAASAVGVPPNSGGYYLNVTTGAFGLVGTVDNPTFGWYTTYSGNVPMLKFGVPTGTGSTNGWQGASLNSPLNLAVGTEIGASSAFYNGTGLNAAFHQSGTEIAGYKFLNPDTGVENYGWIEITTVSGGGYPAAIVDWGYEDSGASAFAGVVPAVPEPEAASLLGAGPALVALRRRVRRA